MANIYSSLPLKTTDTIRLLHVAGGIDGGLTGTLHTVRLTQKPEFDALSYVHGVDQNREIKCGSHQIFISDNCYQALEHLIKVRPLTIWVDMVCMQESEKHHHLPLVSSIYRNAANTYLWLGVGDKGTDAAMAFMATGGMRHFFYKDGHPSRGEIPHLVGCFWRLYRKPYVLKRLKDNIRFKTREGERVATQTSLVQLFNSIWITRIWTFAETVYAANPIVVCGDQQVCWSYFAMTLLTLHNCQAFTGIDSWYRLILSKDYIEDGLLRRYVDIIRELSRRRDWITNFKVWFSFSILVGFIVFLSFKQVRSYWAFWLIGLGAYIVLFGSGSNLSLKGTNKAPLTEADIQHAIHWGIRERKAKNPRDLYYAMQGVIKKETQLPWQELTKYLIQNGGLSLLEKAAQARSSPSWVPDWDRISTEWILHTSSRVATLKSTSGTPKPTIVGNELTVTGTRLYTIDEIFTIQPTQSDYDVSEHDIHVSNYRAIQAMLRAGKGKSTYRPAHKELRKLKLRAELLAFLNTLWSDETRPTDLAPKYLVEYVQHFTDELDTSFWPPWAGLVTDMFRVHLAFCRLMIRHQSAFFRGVGDSWIGKACSGICLTNSNPGDDVVLVEGVKFPLIMRAETNYHLVCPSFVFGMMHGEAWEKKENGKIIQNRREQITIV